MSLALTITNLVGQLNDTMTVNNGGTVMVSLSDALSGGLGSTGITDRQAYNLEAEHIAFKVLPAIKPLGGGGGAVSGQGLVGINYEFAAVETIMYYTDIQAFQADFASNFATYYPALNAL